MSGRCNKRRTNKKASAKNKQSRALNKKPPNNINNNNPICHSNIDVCETSSNSCSPLTSMENAAVPSTSGEQQYCAVSGVLRQTQQATNLVTAARRQTHNQCQPQTAAGPSIGLPPINETFRTEPPDDPLLHKYRGHTPQLPAASWANSDLVWSLMCWKDQVYKREQSYHHRHPEVSDRMRAILIDWMSEVSEVYKLHRETFYLAVDIFDRFMSKRDGIMKQQLQLVGVTALFIAAKLEEIYPPKIAEFAYVTDGACRETDIQQVELIILKTLGWALSPVTAVHWLGVYLQVAEAHLQLQRELQTPAMSAEQRFKRQLFTNPNISSVESNNISASSRQSTVHRKDHLSLPEYHRNTFTALCQLLDLCVLDSGWLRFSYGVLAASAVYSLAQHPHIALQISGYTMDELLPCVTWMRSFAHVCRGLPEPLVRHFSNVLSDDQHNIQSHTVTITDLDTAAELAIKLMHSIPPHTDPVTPGDNLGATVAGLFPTPPPSDERPEPKVRLSSSSSTATEILKDKNNAQHVSMDVVS